MQRRLRRGVVGVTRLPEPAGGRANEDEVAAAGALDDTEEAARGEERRREIRAQRLLPAFQGKLPDRLVVARPGARHGGAHFNVSHLREQLVDLRLVREIRLHGDGTDLGGEFLGALAARVEVEDDVGTLRRKRAYARRADPAGAAGDEDALACKACLHGADVIVPLVRSGEGQVVRISISPVKALHLVHPEEIELTRAGVVGDRRFWLVDEDGRLANGKRFPQLMQIRPEWDESTRTLAFDLPGGERIEGVVEPGEPVDAVLYGESHPSRRVAGPWQEAISDLAGEPLTMLWSERGAVDRGAWLGGWASIVSRGSLERLREEAGAAEPPDGRQFRMLFEIDGVDAHEEDEWIGGRVRVGEAVLMPLGDVGRCVVTTRNPDTGEFAFGTLDTLAGYRREGVSEPLPLGIYCDVAEPGRVRVGDSVAVA